MKKILMGFGVLFLSLELVACSNTAASDNSESENVKSDTQKKESSNVTFKNGVYQTKEFKLTLKDSKIIHSVTEGKPGLFLIYEVTNYNKEKTIVPNDLSLNFEFKQQNDTSLVTLEDNYYYYDAFGEENSTEESKKNLKLASSITNELLPGKTTTFATAYSLDNDSKPVEITALDNKTFEPIGTYKLTMIHSK